MDGDDVNNNGFLQHNRAIGGYYHPGYNQVSAPPPSLVDAPATAGSVGDNGHRLYSLSSSLAAPAPPEQSIHYAPPPLSLPYHNGYPYHQHVVGQQQQQQQMLHAQHRLFSTQQMQHHQQIHQQQQQQQQIQQLLQLHPSSIFFAHSNPLATAAATTATSMTPSMEVAPPYFNSWVGGGGGNNDSDNGNNAMPQQQQRGNASHREQQGQDYNCRPGVIATPSAVAGGSMTVAGNPGFDLGFANNSSNSSNNDVPPMPGFHYRDAMMAMTMMEQLQQQQHQQLQRQPRRSQQQQTQQQEQQKVAAMASGHGECGERSSCDNIFLQSMHQYQQQQQQHYGAATTAIMGYRASPSMMGGLGNLQNHHQRLEDQSALSNADMNLVERQLTSSNGVRKSGSGSTDPAIASLGGGSSFATMNNASQNGGDGSWQRARDAAEGKIAFVGAPAESTSPNFPTGSMSSSLFGVVGGVAKEYDPKQMPPVIPAGRGWNANEPVMMHDKLQPIITALAATDLSAAAPLPSTSPQLSTSRDDNLVSSPNDSATGPIAAAAAAAAEPTTIAEMATMTTATIACQTSPNMKVVSREKIIVASKSQSADPSKEKVPLIAKSVVADPSRETNVSTDKSQTTEAAVADSTSTDYLRSLIPRRLKKRKKSKCRSNHITENADRCAPIKEISIPSNFSPGHSYRAAAAYSLIRTLSKELRLSPFTLQAFTSALMLPIPSKLLGEVHVRVLRVLFASAVAEHRNGGGKGSNGNMGGYYYEKFGDGGVVDLIARRGRSKRNDCSDNVTAGGGGRNENSRSFGITKVEEKEEVEYEFVRKRGGNNLFFLDQCTWPLFYQDYALMSTEGKYLDVMGTTQNDGGNDGDDDEEEFISIKSVAMAPLNGIDLHPKVIPKFIDKDRVPSGANSTSGTNFSLEWADRCPVGPLGRRNQYGRFVCCPFHISAAVQLFRKIHHQPASVATSSSARSTDVNKPSTLAKSTKNRGRNSKKEEKKIEGGQGSSGKKKATSRKSLLSWKGNGNDSSEESNYLDDDDDDFISDDSDNDDDYPSPTKKKSKRNGVDGIPRQHHKSQRPMIPIRPINLDVRHRHHLPSSSSSPMSEIRGVRVFDVQVARPSPDNRLVFVSRDDRSIIPSGSKNRDLIEGGLSSTSNVPTSLDQKQSNVLDQPNPNFVDLTKPIIASTSKPNFQSQVAMISPASQISQPPPFVTQPPVGQETVQIAAAIANHHAQFQGIILTRTATRTDAVALPRNLPQNLQEKIIPSVQRPQSAGPPATTHTRPSFPPVVVPPVRLRSVNSNPLVVSDEIAESVKKILMDEHATSNNGGHSEKKMDTDCIASDRSIQGRVTASLNNDQLLAHMIPVQQLERGIPYHHLSLDAKLTMLEFILDELLQVPEISDEMTRRQTLTSDFSAPYGVPPLPHEYEQICNADECTVCGVEGDLLCCDGCPGSFHRACIGMGATGKLPEGKWLCPECKIVDASKMGPLGSERRPVLRWFTIDDLESSEQRQKSDDQSIMMNCSPTMSMPAKSEPSWRGQLREQQSPSSSSPQIQEEHQATTATDDGHADAASSSSLSPAAAAATAVRLSTSSAAQAWLKVGRMVFVRGRSWPGINCPGGIGHIEKVYTAFADAAAIPGGTVVSSGVTHVDVKYLENELKTRDRGVPIQYVTDHHQLALGIEMEDVGTKYLASRRTAANSIVTFAARETSGMSREGPAPLVHQVAFGNQSIKHSCEVLGNVEFLVTSGKVFARYRSTLQPFDPSNLLASQSHTASLPPFALQKPPVPLNGRQLQELLKIMGPEICLALPWLRIPYSPQKVFADHEMIANGEMPSSPPNFSQEYLRTLISHQNKTKEVIASNSEGKNPMVYLNSYRRAPSVSIVKAHHGLFFFPLNDSPDLNYYPTKSVPLSLALLDLTDHQDCYVSIPVFDPIKPIRDNMICLEQSLRKACLLDLNWGRNKHCVYDAGFWKKKVGQAKSIRKLCSLLIDLVDACCLKAFFPHWYNLKESNLIPDGRTCRLVPSTISEEWSRKQESIRRKWERCKGNDIRRLFNGLLTDALKCKDPTVSKRGNKRKARGESNNATSSSKRENEVESTISEKGSTTTIDASKTTSADPVQAMDEHVSLFSDAGKETVINGSTINPSPCKNVSARSKSSKIRKVPRRESLSSSTSRRHSERLNILRQQIESLLGITEKTSKVERAIDELKLDALEKLLADDDITAVYWAIAGKKLFEPDGSLPRPIVKWLARNAASARAPSVTYDSNYEVGETTVCHRWRKRTMECTTYEGLLHCLKFLDAHIDKSVTITARTIAKRKTDSSMNPITTAVCIVHTDPLTGFNEYFVVPNEKKCGSWYPDESVDLYSLIQYRLEQRRLKKDLKKNELKMNSKCKAPCPAKTMPPAKKLKGNCTGKKNKAEFQAAVDKHRDETLRLLKLSAMKGESCVPTDLMTDTRNVSLVAMTTVNLSIHSAGGKKLTKSALSNLVAKAEKDAITLYTQEARQKMKAQSQLTKSG